MRRAFRVSVSFAVLRVESLERVAKREIESEGPHAID